MNTKHVIQYFATVATTGEPKEKLVSVFMHIGRKGEVALSTNDGGSALATYGKKGGDNAIEQLKHYEKSIFPIFSSQEDNQVL